MSVACLAAGPASAQIGTTPSGRLIYGDLNGDGLVNVQDALLALRVAVGLIPLTPQLLAVADVAPVPGTNGRLFGDGRVNVADALRILRAAVGLELNFPLGRPSNLVGGSFPVAVPNPTMPVITMPTGVDLSGLVFDSARQPVKGFLQIANPTLGITAETPLGVQGSFTLVAPPGAVNFSVVTQFLFQGEETDLVTADVASTTITSQTSFLNILRPNLPPLFEVQGTLLLSDSRFVPQTVQFRDAQGDGDLLRPSTRAAASVGANASFAVAIPSGTYRVSVTGTVVEGGRQQAGVSIQLPSVQPVQGNLGLTPAVPRVVDVSGQVALPNGAAVASGFVEARPPLPQSAGNFAEAPITNGSFTLSAAPGAYNLTVIPSLNGGPSQGSLEYVFSGYQLNGATQFRLRLPAFPSLLPFSATVVDQAGHAVAGALVETKSVALPGGGPSQYWQYVNEGQVYTNTAGRFSLSLPQGRYSLIVIPPGSVPVTVPVQP